MTLTASPVWGPCGWDDPIFCCTIPTGSTALSGSLMNAAALALDAASARVYGLCERTIRPCRRECGPSSGPWWDASYPFGASSYGYGMWPRPALFNGQWFNLTCGACGDTCSCNAIEKAVLPGPVYAVVEVKVDGSVMPTGSYRIDMDNQLVRLDGSMWPTCQNMLAEDTEVDTWSVTAQFGQPVPDAGRLALGQLTCELARGCAGGDCAIPANVVNLARQGVTIQLDVDAPWIERLSFVRLFLDAVNPRRMTSNAEAYDVERMYENRRNRTTAW